MAIEKATGFTARLYQRAVASQLTQTGENKSNESNQIIVIALNVTSQSLVVL